MSAERSPREINRELSNKLTEEVRANPQSPYANRIVGIANGQIVVVGDDLDNVARRLRQAEPDPRKAFIWEADWDESDVVEIWSST